MQQRAPNIVWFWVFRDIFFVLRFSTLIKSSPSSPMDVGQRPNHVNFSVLFPCLFFSYINYFSGSILRYSDFNKLVSEIDCFFTCLRGRRSSRSRNLIAPPVSSAASCFDATEVAKGTIEDKKIGTSQSPADLLIKFFGDQVQVLHKLGMHVQQQFRSFLGFW